jgi:hypothetical protein
MTNEMIEYEQQQPVMFADDTLLAMAEQAERRIEAVIKIKQVALRVTNAGDWVDQNGRPYLQASGAEKIGNLFNISWRIDEPSVEIEEDGHYTYTYRGVFSMSGRSIQVEGSRSSKDGFFRQYVWENNKKTERTVADRDNKRDVKMAALTNLLGNGITRLLGIRNLSYADLEAYAGIKKSDLGKVEYKSEGSEKKDPPKSAVRRMSEQSGQTNETNPNAVTTAQIRAVHSMMTKLEIPDEARHVEASKIISRKIESMNDLTRQEASAVIDHLIKQQPKSEE